MTMTKTLTELRPPSFTKPKDRTARNAYRFLVKVIDVGEGTSAVYTEAALIEAAASRVFRAGTHMYLDHAGMNKRGPHGERSVRELASTLATDAVYDPALKALVAEVSAFADFGPSLEALAPHVGLSVSATAEVAPPLVHGGKPVVSRFVSVESVDWVVKAGRGGEVLAVLESAAAVSSAAAPRVRRTTNAFGRTTTETSESAAGEGRGTYTNAFGRTITEG